MNKKISIIILFVALGALGVYFMSGEKPPTIDQQFQSIINELNKHAHLLNNFKNGDDVEIMQSEYISYRFNIKQIIDNINDINEPNKEERKQYIKTYLSKLIEASVNLAQAQYNFNTRLNDLEKESFKKFNTDNYTSLKYFKNHIEESADIYFDDLDSYFNDEYPQKYNDQKIPWWVKDFYKDSMGAYKKQVSKLLDN